MHIPAMNIPDCPVMPLSRGAFLRHHSVRQSPETLMLSNIQKLVRDVFRTSRASAVHQVERLGDSLSRTYLIRMPNGSEYVLACPPEAGTRLLQHEMDSPDAEADVLSAIASQANVPVPRVVAHSSRSNSFGAPFLLRTSIKGVRLSEIAPRLAPAERSQIDRTVGSFLRRVTSVTGPGFGPGHRVRAGRGSFTWSGAFRYLLEVALRDAEDVLLSVPYQNIRLYAEYHTPLLDDVAVPRLLSLQMGTPRNVIVDEASRQVTGLVGFGRVIWGDPLLAEVFASPGESFWEGYGECPMRVGPEGIRQLLYIVYRSLVSIVAQHVRPQSDDDDLEARRVLTVALNKLSQADGHQYRAQMGL